MERIKIKSPKTKRYIYIDGEAYKKLLNEGYTSDYLLSLSNNHFIQNQIKFDNIENEFTGIKDTDLLILRLLPYYDLYNVCLTNKKIYQLSHNDPALKQSFNYIQHYILNPLIPKEIFISYNNVTRQRILRINDLQEIKHLSYNDLILNRPYLNDIVFAGFKLKILLPSFFVKREIIFNTFVILNLYQILYELTKLLPPKIEHNYYLSHLKFAPTKNYPHKYDLKYTF